MTDNNSGNYNWHYCSVGGTPRVIIDSGEDIAHLGELDHKKWTVLSCPVDGLEFDKTTLDFIDKDHDGRIHIEDVTAAADWLVSVVKDNSLLLKGDSTLKLGNIDTGNPLGQKLYSSAKQILSNLGLDKDEITVDEASDSTAIFAGTKFNGDGVITALSAGDEALAAVIGDCISTIGSTVDRCGENGVTAEQIEAFYTALVDYSAWKAAAPADSTSIFPYGDKTAEALAACEAIAGKISDFFTRCRLLAYDSDVAAGVSIHVDSIDNLSVCPIARPVASGLLPFDGINPFWQPQVNALKALVPQFAKGETVSETAWNEILSSFDAYKAWRDSEKGQIVSPLGVERVDAILAANQKDTLLALVAFDKEYEEESNSIDEVKKLMHLYRDFAKFLGNFVIFSDFYKREPGDRAIFEIGQLYIDRRCCDLCIKVEDMSKHADMAAQSGMFLIYCKCVSKQLGKSMDIVAVMTDGDISSLRPGKNAVFYDLHGNVWDASVTKVVDNPVSIKQAFWSPYRKFWNFCTSLLNKSAADRESKVTAGLEGKVTTAVASASAPGAAPGAAPAATPVKAFDIAKFAGIFAAIGMALGYLGSALTKIVSGVSSAGPLKTLLAVLIIMFLISGPSCFLAWGKLRRRNLGPVLNANGWAVNAKVLVNIVFGKKLTSVVKYPHVSGKDPFKKKTSPWLLALIWLLVLLAAAFAVLYFTGNLPF